MNKAESNQIQVSEGTIVGQIESHVIEAENLQKWAYRRLKVFPELLAACQDIISNATFYYDRGEVDDKDNPGVISAKAIERVTAAIASATS